MSKTKEKPEQAIEGKSREVDVNSSPTIDKPLSHREWEVLDGLSKGDSYKMIADKMGISPKTVPTYIKRLYAKLGVHSATEAIAKVFLKKQ